MEVKIDIKSAQSNSLEIHDIPAISSSDSIDLARDSLRCQRYSGFAATAACPSVTLCNCCNDNSFRKRDELCICWSFVKLYFINLQKVFQ